METERKCSKCPRTLEPGEESLCPKCKADRDRRLKFWGQIVVGGLAFIGAGLAIMTGAKGRNPPK